MDKRKVCKYGSRCYQKNPDHHKKYKHPPKRKLNDDAVSYGPQEKKLKLNT